MITASQTEILKSQRMCDHLTNPRLLIKVRELQVLNLLSQLVLLQAMVLVGSTSQLKVVRLYVRS